jgi:RNA polymerase sigma-70 factor, ECF subfamily
VSAGFGSADVQRLLAAARRRWPDIEVSDDDFASALARRAAAPVTARLPDEDAAAEIYLAIACARADRRALVEFEREYFRDLAAVLSRMNLSPEAIDDVKQAVRHRLFVDEVDGAVRIIDVAGRGDLASFVRVAAIRIALNSLRGDRRREERHHLTAADAWDAGLDDPEAQLLRADQRAAFKAAFETAVAGIDARARNVLRLHLLERLSIDQIADVFGAHRSTAARWLVRAREEVAHRVEEALGAQLALEPQELRDAFALVRSRLEISLSRLFGAQSHEGETPPTEPGRTRSS